MTKIRKYKLIVIDESDEGNKDAKEDIKRFLQENDFIVEEIIEFYEEPKEV